MKIIDCFIFYNELNLLYYRLNVLYESVDCFIIVEANQTHRGKSKPLFFNENKHLFKQFNDKIIHVIIDLPYVHPTINLKGNKPFQLFNYNENGDQWINEGYQRHTGILKGLLQISLDDSDYIIVSDLDEIIDPNTINNIRNNKISISFAKFKQDLYFFNLNYKNNNIWIHPYIISYKFYKEYSQTFDPLKKHRYCYYSKEYSYIFTNIERLFLTELRLQFDNVDLINNGGWHLSYFGDNNFIKNKYDNFAHVETSIGEDINNNIQNSIKIEIEDNKYLPPLYETFLYNFILSKSSIL